MKQSEFRKSIRRAAAQRRRYPPAVAVRYDRRIARIVIDLASGIELMISPKLVRGIEHAEPRDLLGAEISPSGLGIHFPKIDADVYIPALIYPSAFRDKGTRKLRA